MEHLNRFIQDPNEFIKLSKELFENATSTINIYCENLAPWQIILYTSLITFIISYLYHLYSDIDTDIYTYLRQMTFCFIRKLPIINNKIKSELHKTQIDLENEILKANKGVDYLVKLPQKGLNIDKVYEKIETYKKLCNENWKNGACSGCVYAYDDKFIELTTNVYRQFAISNVMHADVFPDVRKMEAEVVRMVCNMFNGDDETCGTMSSGGSESIMLACKAYRDLARKRGIKKPEMIMPSTAHAAFVKAGHYFNIKVNLVPIDPKTKKANVKLMKRYINSNTCMLVGSAPNFPYGTIDPIEDLSNLAVKYKIPLHVDACLGGFLIAFMKDGGFELPLFDFRLPGVTSISCDTHKYGYTPKGSSVIMYRNRDYRAFQYFAFTQWQGGLYASPTFAGSRAGSLIAMTWATMMHIGRDGYIDATKRIINATRYITNELKKIKEIVMMGEPDVSVIAFTSNEFNIYRLLDELSKNWNLNAIQDPAGIHIALTQLHTKEGVADRLINDIRNAVSRIMKQPDRALGKIAQIYCTSQSIQDKSLIDDVSYLYLDACYNTNLGEKKNVKDK